MNNSAVGADRYLPVPQTGSTAEPRTSGIPGDEERRAPRYHQLSGHGGVAVGVATGGTLFAFWKVTALIGASFVSTPLTYAAREMGGYLIPPDPIAKALRALREPGARHVDVVGPLAFESAEHVLERVREGCLTAERVVSTADGEIAFYFRGQERTPGGAHRRYGTIVCDSDGALTALVEDRITRETKAWDVARDDLDEALGIIGDFVGG
jgi:hypothetical protein